MISDSLLVAWRGLPPDLLKSAAPVLQELCCTYGAGGPISLLQGERFLRDLTIRPDLQARVVGLFGLPPSAISNETQDKAEENRHLPVASPNHFLTFDYVQWRLNTATRRVKCSWGDFKEQLSGFLRDNVALPIPYDPTIDQRRVMVEDIHKDVALLEDPQLSRREQNIVQKAFQRLLGTIEIYGQLIAETPDSRDYRRTFLAALWKIYGRKEEPRNRFRFSYYASDRAFRLQPREDKTSNSLFVEVMGKLRGAKKQIQRATTSADLSAQPIHIHEADCLAFARFIEIADLIPGSACRLISVDDLMRSPLTKRGGSYWAEMVSGDVVAPDITLIKAAKARIRAKRLSLKISGQVMEIFIPYDAVFLDPKGRSELKDVMSKIQRGFQNKVILVDALGDYIVIRLMTLSFEEALYEVLYGASAVRYYFVEEDLDRDEVMMLRSCGFSPHYFTPDSLLLGDVRCRIDRLFWDLHERFHAASMAQYSSQVRKVASFLYENVKTESWVQDPRMQRHLDALADMNGRGSDEHEFTFSLDPFFADIYEVVAESVKSREVLWRQIDSLHLLLQRYLDWCRRHVPEDESLREGYQQFRQRLEEAYQCALVNLMLFSAERIGRQSSVQEDYRYFVSTLVSRRSTLSARSRFDLLCKFAMDSRFNHFPAWFDLIRDLSGQVTGDAIAIGTALLNLVSHDHFRGESNYRLAIAHLDLTYDHRTGWTQTTYAILRQLQSKPDFTATVHEADVLELHHSPTLSPSSVMALWQDFLSFFPLVFGHFSFKMSHHES